MTVYPFFIENELHRIFATAELAEEYMKDLQKDYGDIDMYYANVVVDEKP